MTKSKAIVALGVCSVLMGAVFAIPRQARADSKPAPITKKEMTPENLIQLSCIDGGVAGATNAVRDKYWPGVGENDPKLKEYVKRTGEILNADVEFNKALSLLCYKVQSMAKKLSASQGK